MIEAIKEIGFKFKDKGTIEYKELKAELKKLYEMAVQADKEAQIVSLAYVAHINTSAKFYQEVFGKAVELNNSVKVEGLSELFENGQ